MAKFYYNSKKWFFLPLGFLLTTAVVYAQDEGQPPVTLDEEITVQPADEEITASSAVVQTAEYSDNSDYSDYSDDSDYSDNSDYSDPSEINSPSFSMPVLDYREKFKFSQQALGTEKPNYKFLDDMSWAGIPIFVAGIIAKSEKRAFRQDYNSAHGNTRLVLDFKTEVDNYTQYLPPLLAVGLKLGGVEGRSNWPRFLVSSAISYGAMAILVNSIKYTAKEMRPDGSSANSWPSGHTATAFVGATILHKEYGLTESPWYSVAGYATATATGIMRVLNNRHWVSDVLSGAGIGIISGELGYAIADLFFKDKGLRKGDLGVRQSMNREHPSFFDVSMGIGLGANELSFNLSEYADNEDIFADGVEADDDIINLKFATATVVGVEGAYFFNKYVGIGGRFRVASSPIKGWDKVADYMAKDLDESIREMKNNDPVLDDFVTNREFNIVSDHITEFTADAGLYLNFPINDRLAIGAKALIGRSMMQELDLDLTVKGNKKNFFTDMVIKDNQLLDFSTRIEDAGEQYTSQWDFLTVGADNSTKFGTGISLTYSYKNNFCWKVFCDYDYTKKTYTMTFDPYEFYREGIPDLMSSASMLGIEFEPIVRKVNKNMNRFVLGASFSVAF